MPDDLSTAAKWRQKQLRHAMTTAGAIGLAKRPQYLVSGLTKMRRLRRRIDIVGEPARVAAIA